MNPDDSYSRAGASLHHCGLSMTWLESIVLLSALLWLHRIDPVPGTPACTWCRWWCPHRSTAWRCPAARRWVLTRGSSRTSAAHTAAETRPTCSPSGPLNHHCTELRRKTDCCQKQQLHSQRSEIMIIYAADQYEARRTRMWIKRRLRDTSSRSARSNTSVSANVTININLLF